MGPNKSSLGLFVGGVVELSVTFAIWSGGHLVLHLPRGERNNMALITAKSFLQDTGSKASYTTPVNMTMQNLAIVDAFPVETTHCGS